MIDLEYQTRTRLADWVDQSVRRRFPDAGPHPAATVFGRCLTHLGQAAVAARGAADGDGLRQDFDRIADFVWQMAWAVGGEDQPTDANFWRHMAHPVADVRQDRARTLWRTEIEILVDQYLDLPVKAAYVDRLLLDMLAGCEVVAYAKTVFAKEDGINPPLLQSAGFSAFLKTRAQWVALWGGLYLVAGLLGWDWCQTVILWLGAIETLIGIGCYPFARRMILKNNAKALDPLRAMCGVYAALDSSGAISARHLLEQATKTQDAGVAWPSPLFVLLDDALARGGRL